MLMYLYSIKKKDQAKKIIMSLNKDLNTSN